LTLLGHARNLVTSPTAQILLALAGQNFALHILLLSYQSALPVVDILSIGMVCVILLTIPKRRAKGNLQLSLALLFGSIITKLEHRVETSTNELAAANKALERENSQRERIERRLAEEATQDQLTGLANRRRFLMLLDEFTTKYQKTPYAIFFIDIDHFKLINDGLGHALGDRALIAIADRLDQALQPHTISGRVVCDVYADATHVESHEAAEEIAQRIISVLRNPIAIGERIVYSAASVGVRYCLQDHESASSLLRDAHTAMNLAKVAGRARYVFFDEQMQTDLQQRFTLNTELRQAVERDQFFVEYQPIFSLLDGRPTGYEALVRWTHPRRGRVEPGVFIPAAEDSGLVVAIGSLVLYEVCAEIAKRGITPLTPVGINLSPRQIEQPNLIDIVKTAIEENGIAPECIMLEVTESIFVENLATAREVLRNLKELGVLIAIDDFGTGYSSLSYLQELPFDVLKIDRSFIRRIDQEATSRDIVRMLVTLADSLNMVVVAEGIETEEQLVSVRNAGCLKGQGYLFSRPLAPDLAFAVTAVPLAAVL